MHRLLYLLLFLTVSLLTACGDGHPAAVPTESRAVSEAVRLYPDYRDITIPPNIAPLNLRVRNAGSEFVVEARGRDGHSVTAGADGDQPLCFDPKAWHDLLEASRGNRLTLTLYVRREGEWLRMPSWQIEVASEPIDRYLSYRLIEPSYEAYRQMGLYQRDLQGFDERTIYENNRTDAPRDNHCINCHSYQNYSTRRMMFHVRAAHGGTVFVSRGEARKVSFPTDSLHPAPVYPAWHPQHNWLAFSVNRTGQAFHLTDPDKVEVVDFASDLVFYDADSRRLTPITATDDSLETFPTWSPDGRRLYYTCAAVPQLKGAGFAACRRYLASHYREVRYDVMSRTFDPATRTFGPPVTEYACASHGLSASVPRVSPDGRYLLFTLARFGQFHIWHRSADLYVKDLLTGHTAPLTAANAPGRPDSYHSWSSNGRWIVFASRRDDGTYTRVYISYFDRQGRAHKAFLLPQADPESNLLRAKSYNVPELTRDAVTIPADRLRECIYADERSTGAQWLRGS